MSTTTRSRSRTRTDGLAALLPLPSCRCRPAVGDYLERTGPPYAVDIKAQRKLEELNQTLWMFFTPPGEGVITYNWDLSIGLKLP